VSHAVIGEYFRNPEPFLSPGSLGENTGSFKVLLLSGPQEKRLRPQAKTYQPWILADGMKHSLSSIATTLATRRGHHDYRAAFVVESHEDAAGALKAFSEDAPGAWSVSGRVLGNDTSRDSVWVFSGHGAQWNEMGRELLSNVIFHEAIALSTPL